MNTTRDSSNNTPDLIEKGLSFVMVPVERLAPLSGLFDDRTPGAQMEPSLLVPLIVWKDCETFFVVDGHRRLKNLREKGETSCPAGVISAPFDARRAGLLRIDLNAGRAKTRHEKLIFIRWMKRELDTETYTGQTEKLGCSAHERYELERLLSCPDPVVDAVLDSVLDITVAPELTHLKTDDAAALISLFSALALSRQMQRELAEWLPETALTERTTVAALLADRPFATILQGTLNAPQKAARLLAAAHDRRFPLLAEVRRKWDANARTLNPDASRVSFTPSPFFEKRELEIRIKVRDPRDAGELMRRLAAIDERKWRTLIDPADTHAGEC